MKVTIKGSSFDYESDFDEVAVSNNNKSGWQKQAGDYFKPSVEIGGVRCFIKRFGRPSGSIPGYGFLQKVKGQQLRGLPMIYDLVETVEIRSGKKAIYLFLESIEGETLFHLQNEGFSFYPHQLTDDLYFGLNNIHLNGYWFPDFDPKNFMQAKLTGQAYVIDLDSMQPLSSFPDPAMDGSRNFWTPVIEFYAGQGIARVEIRKMRGDLLNMLQLLYLTGLYASYLKGEAEDFSAESILQLNVSLPGRYPVFTTVMQQAFHKDPGQNQLKQRPLTHEVTGNLIRQHFFPSNNLMKISTRKGQKTMPLPKISFRMRGGRLVITRGEEYILEWNTTHATTVQLDGKTQAAQGTVKFNADRNCQHILQASNSQSKQVQSVISVRVVPIPTINIYVAPAEVTDAGFVTVRWDSKDAQDMYLTAGDATLEQSCPAEGSKSINVWRKPEGPDIQYVHFVLFGKNGAGDLYKSSTATVTVRKKTDTPPTRGPASPPTSTSNDGCASSAGCLFWAVLIIVAIYAVSHA